MLNLNLRKQLGQLNLNVNLAIPTQGITVIFGCSGSGKTTLLQLISGLIKPDKGIISLNEQVFTDTQQGIFIPPALRNLGYVFQDARIFPHYSVQGNLTYGMKSKDHTQVAKIVDLLHLKQLMHRSPNTLSGGEQQRLAIGRALLSNPQILLMDEPLSALDVPMRKELLSYLESLQQEIQIPIIYVTHNLEEMLRLGERVLLLEKGKVLAFDEVQKIYTSNIFEPWRK